MTAAELYLAVSGRLLKLRLEREVADDEEGEWASVLSTFWEDLDEGGRDVVEEGIAARRELVVEGFEKQAGYLKARGA